MENQQKMINMMMMFERMLQEQQEMLEITMVVQELAQRNGQFNGKDVSRYLWGYKAEMLQYGISKRLEVRSFNRVATDELQERIHGIQQQNPIWGSFEEALQEAYDYKRPKGRIQREFDQWVASAKIHQSATQAFLEFERCFPQLSERVQGLVGLDKVLRLVRSIDRKERMAITTNIPIKPVRADFFH